MSGIHLALASSFSAAASVIYGAVSFDGSGDYYQATGISTSATDNGILTLGCTFYWNGGDNLQQLVNVRLGTGGADYGFWVWINGGRMQAKMVSGTGSVPTSIYENAENSLTTNAWNQVIIYWNTANYTTGSYIYVNGSSKAKSNEGTPANSWNWGNTATTIKIGQKNTSQTGDGTDFNGRIGQLFISKANDGVTISQWWDSGQSKPYDLGTYGTNTGLTAPLIYHNGSTTTFPTNKGTGFASYTLTANGNVANAELPAYSTGRVAKTLTATGNAKVSTAQSKFSGASALFDGTGDYVLVEPASGINFGTGNWTIEGWYRASATSGDHYVLNFKAPTSGISGLYDIDSGNGHWGINIYQGNWRAGAFNNKLVGGVGSGVNTGIDTTTWHHFALVRDSATTLKYYIDGTQIGSTVTLDATDNFDSSVMYLGNFVFQSGGATGWNGYLDEIRISKIARYTGNFTAPSSAFTNDSNTMLLIHCDGANNSTTFTDDAA